MVNTIEVAPAHPPAFLGQATQIEQSRAIAEVQAMVIVAQQCPRDLTRVLSQMRESCRQTALAERAFFRFPRGGSTVSGPSIHLARELARCFGNVTHGVSELRRDDAAGFSEMQAWAWDLEANTRSAVIFIVPHMRDKQGGPVRLTDLRDIYESNANNGARRLREAIFSILPPWFVEEAKDICTATLREGGGKPLAQRVTDAIKAFEGIGVSVDRIESKIGRKAAKWNEHDIAQLTVTFKSINRNEVTIDEEFPSNRVTAAEILQTAKPADPPAQPADQPPAEPDPTEGMQPERLITRAQQTKLHILLDEAGFGDRDLGLEKITEILGRPDGNPVLSSKDLTVTEASACIEELARLLDPSS